MAWVVEKLNQIPAVYYKVDNQGLIATTSGTNDAMKFQDKASADQFRALLQDASQSTQV